MLDGSLSFLLYTVVFLRPGGAAQYGHLVTSHGLQLQMHHVLASYQQFRGWRESPPPFHTTPSIVYLHADGAQEGSSFPSDRGLQKCLLPGADGDLSDLSYAYAAKPEMFVAV